MNKSRSGSQVMFGLIGMIRPLLAVMFVAILMGSIGNLMAIFITVLGGVGIGNVLGIDKTMPLTTVFVLAIIFAVLRGILRYAEQASNHYIAFKLLASIRHQIFSALRKLAPAKLDGKEKGNLISIITSDIELLEVFYAHTISPIVIAVLTSGIMVLFIGQYHWILGVIALFFYILVGAVIPIINSKAGQKYGQKYRKLYGNLNTTVLDNLYGLDEILQYGKENDRKEKMDRFTDELEGVNEILKQQEGRQRTVLDNLYGLDEILQYGKENDRKEKMDRFTDELEGVNEILKQQEGRQRISTDIVILLAGVVMILASATLVPAGETIICTIAMMSSFGPTGALSALSNNLNQTLASGNRVLNLLEEEPIVTEIKSDVTVPKGELTLSDVTFGYPNAEKNILKNFSLQIKENTIHGILGESGCGKSTILKLLMRFYETKEGQVSYGNQNVNEIDTEQLRNQISYVTQETFLFEDTIENNIKVAKADATREEVIAAAKKASIHEFILSLPLGYDTKLAELGDSVSGGERQRIGIARAFLHDAPIILLDEPTSNIDSLNEGIILKTLLEEKENKTIVLVSHRKSTMSIADKVSEM